MPLTADQERVLKSAGNKSTKIAPLIKFPNTRACPKCSYMQAHKDQCQEVECGNCKHKFCYCCLTSCGAHYTPCSVGIAPRQTANNLAPTPIPFTFIRPETK